MQDKIPYNKKGQLHGLVEELWSNGELREKSYYLNNKPFGCLKIFGCNGKIRNISYFCR